MILLDFGGQIVGDSGVPDHEEWITCDTVNFNAQRNVTISGSDRETSNPVIPEVVITKSTDIASCDLFWQACGGVSLGTATLSWVQQAGTDSPPQVFMKVELAKAIVTSYSASSAGERPTETITLNFSEIKVSYWKFKEGEEVEEATPRGWHVLNNTSTLDALA